MTTDHLFQRPQLSPHARYHWDTVRKQHQLLFPEGVLVLNHTSAAIIRRCDGRSLDCLINELEQEFPDARILDDVHHFLQEMMRRGFVHDTTPSD